MLWRAHGIKQNAVHSNTYKGKLSGKAAVLELCCSLEMLAEAGCTGKHLGGSRRDIQPRFEATRMLAEITAGVMACWPPQVKLL